MDWIVKYWIQWLFGIIGAALVVCIRKLCSIAKYEKTEQRAVRESLKAILHDRIFEAFRYYMKIGCIDQAGMENLQTLWEAYVHWGGNGTGKTYYRKIRDLPFWDIAVVQNLMVTSTNNPTYLVYLAAQVMMNDVSLLSK